jgi:hypothetical protein
MNTKYGISFSPNAVQTNLKRLTNQIYKLLPLWEEAADWNKPLITIIEELVGMNEIFIDHQESFLSLISKLEGLKMFLNEDNFFDFRRIIFDCLNLISNLGVQLCQ